MVLMILFMLMEIHSCVTIWSNLMYMKAFHLHYKCSQWFSSPWWLVHNTMLRAGGGVAVLKQQGYMSSDGPGLES